MENSIIQALIEMGTPWLLDAILLWLLLQEKKKRDELIDILLHDKKKGP